MELENSGVKFCRHGEICVPSPSRCADSFYVCFGCGDPIILADEEKQSTYGTNNDASGSSNTNDATPTSLTSTSPLQGGTMVAPSADRYFHARCFRCYECDKSFYDLRRVASTTSRNNNANCSKRGQSNFKNANVMNNCNVDSLADEDCAVEREFIQIDYLRYVFF
jgi:hypothetical protein